MTTQEVADRLVALCREGKNAQAVEELYAENIVSMEPAGAPNHKAEGLVAVKAKTDQFFSMVEEFHGGYTSEPLVAGNHFTVSMGMDITMKGQPRRNMDEICIYQVENGKIVREEFFFQAK